MKKGIIALIIVALVMGGFVTCAFSMAQAPKSFQVTGKIVEVNLRAHTIKIAPKTEDTILLRINEKTVLTKSGKQITLPALKKDDLVTVTYEIRRGKKIAKSISVQEKIPAPKRPVSTKGKR
ncbi:MAG: hypothetical protein HZA27_02960 [Candidatus Omnitrophica bacterium]|nr:hypothetical protein [Candidatus Omnitrophota bacterium]